MNILVTGGAGYIGSHTCMELLTAGHQVTVVDNLINSKRESLVRVRQITGKKLDFHQVDLLDARKLEAVFAAHPVDMVIHFAGLKAVGESVKVPLSYYHNNLIGTITLLETMTKFNVKNLVFSSSATVYGEPHKTPITENFPLQPTNPYGWTKLMIEQILRDLSASDPDWNIAILRYFNPVGAHPSGLIGEDPQGLPNNLMPFIAQVAVGKIKELSVYGNDYPTPDGTGVRDYIHVVDLAVGHVKAIIKLASHPGLVTYNLGTGKGVSVLEMIGAFTKASGKTIPFKIVPRRPGDTTIVLADPTKARHDLDWQAVKTLADMCADTWHWQSQNPHGY